AERRDATGHATALARAATWLPRLWPESPARSARRAELEAIAAMPLKAELPTLGTTLDQLRRQRMRRGIAPLPAPRITIDDTPRRAELEARAAMPLMADLPPLGTPLAQLRRQRRRRGMAPLPAPRITMGDTPCDPAATD